MDLYVSDSLLAHDEPEPTQIIEGPDPGLLLECEHAGCAVPRHLCDLGLVDDDLKSHIGWDIGTAHLTRNLSQRLGAPAVMQRYSRLVIDCNRSPDSPDSMPEISHGVSIPGNRNLSSEDRLSRRKSIFDPFDRAVGNMMSKPGLKLAIAIHSFTPFAFGVERPWDIGFLYRQDPETADKACNLISRLKPSVIIGHNQPYRIGAVAEWFIPKHVEPRGLPHLMIEIRNEHIATSDGAEEWSELLADVIFGLRSKPDRTDT